jgi:outer membrane protein assembly factor BamB
LYLRPGRLFAYTASNDVYGLDRATGAQMFAATTVVPSGEKLWAPIVLKDYMVFPSAFTIEVYSIKGDLLKSQQLDDFSITGNGCGSDGAFIYIGAVMLGADPSAAGRLACIDVSDAYVPLNWSLVTQGVTGSPAFMGSTVYVGGQDGGVRAVDSNRGTAWALTTNDMFKTDNAIIGDVSVDAASVYVASMDTRLYCIDRMSGKLRWQYFAQVPLPDGPVVTGTNVYLKVPDVGIVAISKTSGGAIRKPAWTQPDARQFLAEDDRNAYFRMNDNSLLGANKLTGETVFQSAPTNFSVYASNTSKEGTFYAGTDDGHVFLIKPVLVPGVFGEVIPPRSMDRSPAAGQ